MVEILGSSEDDQQPCEVHSNVSQPVLGTATIGDPVASEAVGSVGPSTSSQPAMKRLSHSEEHTPTKMFLERLDEGRLTPDVMNIEKLNAEFDLFRAEMRKKCLEQFDWAINEHKAAEELRKQLQECQDSLQNVMNDNVRLHNALVQIAEGAAEAAELTDLAIPERVVERPDPLQHPFQAPDQPGTPAPQTKPSQKRTRSVSPSGETPKKTRKYVKNVRLSHVLYHSLWVNLIIIFRISTQVSYYTGVPLRTVTLHLFQIPL